jgi:hypothetical protein
MGELPAQRWQSGPRRMTGCGAGAASSSRKPFVHSSVIGRSRAGVSRPCRKAICYMPGQVLFCLGGANGSRRAHSTAKARLPCGTRDLAPGGR